MIVGIMNVLNEAELLNHFFEHNLKLVDKLIIAEGGVRGHPFTTNEGHSIDDTLKILGHWKRKYNDKIEIITQNEKWYSKQDQQNATLDYLEDNDWCWGSN